MAQNDQTQTDAQKAETQRQADAQRSAAARPAAGDARTQAARSQEQRRADVDRERQERERRPQQVEGRPTPTQQENDEIRSGVRHIDDKEHDGSPPERLPERALTGAPGRGYETR